MPFVAPPPNAEYTDIVEAAFGYTRDVDSATWVWTDITKYVRGAITISKGRPDATSTADPTHIQLTLENDGRFTGDNPNSPYWPNIQRGTPIRVRRGWKNSTTYYERATGFVAGWPVVPVAGVRYVLTPIHAWGRLRWLRRNNTLVSSPMFRTLSGISPTAYWSLEDGADATSGASAVAGQSPMRAQGPVTFGASGPPGATAGIDFTGGGSMTALIRSATSGSFRLIFGARMSDLTTDRTPVRIYTSTGLFIDFFLQPTANNLGFSVSDLTSGGGLLFYLAGETITHDTDWHLWQFTLVQSGANVNLGFYRDNTLVGTLAGGTAYTLGVAGRITLNPLGSTTLEMSHVAVITPTTQTPANATSVGATVFGYAGESATARMARLGTENAVPVTTAVGIGTPQPLGAQAADTLGNLFDAAAAADCGLLHDGGPNGDLAYASPGVRYNAAPQLSVVYALSQISDGFEGTDDDQQLTNDVTITRSGGSSGRWVNTASATAEGQIGTGDTLNLHDDQQPNYVAQLRANLSSYKAMRFPLAPLDFRRNPELVQAWTSLTLPAYIAITGVPSPFPPSSIDQFIEGYTETLDAVTWTVTANCSPAAPWRVGVLDDTTNPFRLDADWSAAGTVVTSSLVVNAGVSATALSFGLKTLSGPLVTTSGGDFPMLIEAPATGEVMQLTNVTGGASPQTATVTRSINGVVKALPTNTPIRLYRPATLAL